MAMTTAGPSKLSGDRQAGEAGCPSSENKAASVGYHHILGDGREFDRVWENFLV